MTHTFTLAAIDDVIQLIIYGIVAVFVVGGWINNARKAQQGGAATGGVRKAPSTDLQLEEVAARRRRQLQELAKRRSGQVKASTTEAKIQPDNLSMRESVERTRARAEYERRAAELRRQQAQQQARQQQAQQGGRQPQRARPQPRPGGARPRQVAPAPEPVILLEEHESVPRRLLADAPPLTPAEPVAGAHKPGTFRAGVVAGRSLREAFIIKELLDRPRALRDHGDELL